MSKKSFKIVYGHRADQEIEITKADLPNAYYSFITDAKFISQAGIPCDFPIKTIKPNWHAVMGWNKSHPLGSREFMDIGSHRVAHAEALMKSALSIAKKAISTGDMKLLDQPLSAEMGHYELPESVDNVLAIKS